MAEVYYSGNAQDMQKKLGQDDFSRAISMEGVQRTMGAQLQERLKLIATGQPIPEDEPETEEAPENAEEEEAVVETAEEAVEAVEAEETPETEEPVEEASEPESEQEEPSEEKTAEEETEE